jgi:NAD(P)-dependent dehydrogenase (short-subunit alcohol dehydrogenase family)
MAFHTEKSTFSLETMPDLAGKNVIVTGGNAGIGYETCLALLKKNATVYMASRSKQRADAAIEKLLKGTGKNVEFLELDLQDLKKVKKAAEVFLEKGIKLDILINNAGKDEWRLDPGKYSRRLKTERRDGNERSSKSSTEGNEVMKPSEARG